MPHAAPHAGADRAAWRAPGPHATQAMLRDSAQLAEQANSIPHINTLDFVMEALALGGA